MKSIDQKDYELIKDLYHWKIDANEFKRETEFKANFEELRYLLYSVKDCKDEEGYNQFFNSILWELPKKLSEKDYETLYQEFLLCNFHSEHEEIAGAFQIIYNNNIENIPILLKAIDNIPKYLEPEDFKYPYVRKIIYAIGAQPQPESLLALEKLASETDDEKIKELALHQLEKRKRLGRWEQKKKDD
jgi:hypothetical protein